MTDAHNGLFVLSENEGWLKRFIKTERRIMQTPPKQADGLMSPIKSEIKSEVLKEYQFRINEVPHGSALLVGNVTVFNVAGDICATEAKCTHKQGPLSEGKLVGSTVTCPWHGSQFNVCTGAVLRGPAADPLKTYSVIAEIFRPDDDR